MKSHINAPICGPLLSNSPQFDPLDSTVARNGGGNTQRPSGSVTAVAVWVTTTCSCALAEMHIRLRLEYVASQYLQFRSDAEV